MQVLNGFNQRITTTMTTGYLQFPTTVLAIQEHSVSYLSYS